MTRREHPASDVLLAHNTHGHCPPHRRAHARIVFLCRRARVTRLLHACPFTRAKALQALTFLTPLLTARTPVSGGYVPGHTRSRDPSERVSGTLSLLD